MTNISSQIVWETLSVPIPTEFAHHANLNRQIETLERKNNTGMYIILGIGMLLIGVSVYLMIEEGKKKKSFKKG